MADEAGNVEIVERLWRGTAELIGRASAGTPLETVLEAPEARGAIATLIELLDPEVELDFSEFEGWPEERVYHGPEGMLSFWRAYLSAWNEISWDFERFIPIEDKVVVLLRQRARGRASGAWTVLPPYAQVWTLRDGRVIRLKTYTDRKAALRDIGLKD